MDVDVARSTKTQPNVEQNSLCINQYGSHKCNLRRKRASDNSDMEAI